jgi:transposase
MTGEHIAAAARMWAQGKDTRDIAKLLGVEEPVIYRWLGEIRARAALREPA